METKISNEVETGNLQQAVVNGSCLEELKAKINFTAYHANMALAKFAIHDMNSGKKHADEMKTQLDEVIKSIDDLISNCH